MSRDQSLHKRASNASNIASSSELPTQIFTSVCWRCNMESHRTYWLILFPQRIQRLPLLPPLSFSHASVISIIFDSCDVSLAPSTKSREFVLRTEESWTWKWWGLCNASLEWFSKISEINSVTIFLNLISVYSNSSFPIPFVSHDEKNKSLKAVNKSWNTPLTKHNRFYSNLHPN